MVGPTAGRRDGDGAARHQQLAGPGARSRRDCLLIGCLCAFTASSSGPVADRLLIVHPHTCTSSSEGRVCKCLLIVHPCTFAPASISSSQGPGIIHPHVSTVKPHHTILCIGTPRHSTREGAAYDDTQHGQCTDEL